MVATFGGGCHGGVPFLGAMAAVAGVPLLGAMVVWHGGGGRDGALNHGYIRYTVITLKTKLVYAIWGLCWNISCSSGLNHKLAYNFLRQERWADVRDGPAPAARLEDFAPAAEPGQPSAGERTDPFELFWSILVPMFPFNAFICYHQDPWFTESQGSCSCTWSMSMSLWPMWSMWP